MKFIKLLSQREILLLDGAMGTEIIKRGLKPGELPESWNIEHPQLIRQIHQEYIEAGSEVIITNTFGANRLKLSRSGSAERFEEFNRRGVRIAREVAGEKVLVAGDIGPTGELIAPYGECSFQDFYLTFKEQAEILQSEGVDLFIIETVSDPQEMKAAIRALKENFSLPVLASMRFDHKGKDFRTMMGTTVEKAVEAMNEADVLGVNCGEVTPQEMAEIVRIMRKITSKPLLAEPNAGLPQLIDGKTIYDLSPESFLEGMRAIIRAGGVVVGGCCGTTSRHIKLLSTLKGEKWEREKD